MRKWFVLSYALALLGFFAIPARPMFFNPPMFMPQTAAVAYSGPGDVVAATAWWGLRAYTSALANAGATTTRVIDVRGVTTLGACTIFLRGNGTGGLDLTTAGAGGIGNQCLLGATTFCTSTNTSCTVSAIYEQSAGGQCTASCNLVQGTAANQPTFTFNCIGALPCLTSNITASPTNGGLISASNLIATSYPVGVSFVAKRTGATSAFAAAFGVGSSGLGKIEAGFGNAVNTVLMYAGTVANLSGNNDNVWHAVQQNYNGASSSANVDGTSTTGLNVGLNGLVANPFAMAPGPSDALTGVVGEAGFFGPLNATQQTNLCKNQQAYYGSGNFGAAC